jgi:hypothetical protein
MTPVEAPIGRGESAPIHPLPALRKEQPPSFAKRRPSAEALAPGAGAPQLATALSLPYVQPCIPCLPVSPQRTQQVVVHA